MKATTILTDLFNSPEMASLLGRMNPDHLRDDLKQELFLVLCEKPEQQIVSLHQAGQLRYYTARIAWNMIASNTSPFYRKFRNHLKEYMDDLTIEETKINFGKNACLCSPPEEAKEFEQQHTNLLDAVNKSLDGMHWYDRELFRNYVDAGSAGKLVKQMKDTLAGNYIPKRTILLTVKKVRERVQKEVKRA